MAEREAQIRVVVSDLPTQLGARSSLEGLVDRTIIRVEAVAVDVLAASLQRTIKDVYEILNAVPFEAGRVHLRTVSFSLEVNASGEVALVGTVGASAGGKMGLSFEMLIDD